MLGYVTKDGRGRVDDLLAGLAERLAQGGVRVAGAVQLNGPAHEDLPCDMDLRILTGDRVIRISQNLGTMASGCRLDPEALAEAVGAVEAALAAPEPPDLLIVNKFGKQEAEGQGFRNAIGAALAADVPVLVGLPESQRAAFLTWAGDLAEAVAPERLDLWCKTTIGTV